MKSRIFFETAMLPLSVRVLLGIHVCHQRERISIIHGLDGNPYDEIQYGKADFNSARVLCQHGFGNLLLTFLPSYHNIYY